MNFFTFILVGFVLSEVARDVKCILNGENAALKDFKYMAFVKGDLGGGCVSRCGGAIINSKHILTAGHCADFLDRSQLKVEVGVTDLRTSPVGKQVLDIERIIIHPDFPVEGKPTIFGWIKGTFKHFFDTEDPEPPESSEKPKVIGPRRPHDIAVLRLTTEIKMGDTVQPISLPPANAPVSPWEPCNFSGWGRIAPDDKTPRPDILQKAIMTIYGPDAYVGTTIAQHDWLFAAGQYEGEKDIRTLNGDSGGPFVCKDILVGVASNSAAPATSFFMKVSYYIEFIKKSARML